MKKINSIWFGGKIIGCGMVFAVVIPLILSGLVKLLPPDGVIASIARISIKVSIGIGVFAFIAIAVILFIELRQDKKLNSRYDEED